MPLWGTCMGFQWLLISASRDQNILDPKEGQMDAYNMSLPLDFTTTALDSKMFSAAPDYIYKTLGTLDVTMNNHHYGIWTDHFKATDSLSSFFNMLSTNVDGNGDEFVSTIEAFDYPIFGSQWHPEKNIFE
jgi:gamma-glutamyl hydrolase